MNKVILVGRLTRDPEIRYTSGQNQTAVGRYTLAVDRRYKKEGDEQTADFINCVTFGRGAEFAEKYLHQGTKIAVVGRIQTGSYTNRDGQKVYTTVSVCIPRMLLQKSRNLLKAKLQQVNETQMAVRVRQADRMQMTAGMSIITVWVCLIRQRRLITVVLCR